MAADERYTAAVANEHSNSFLWRETENSQQKVMYAKYISYFLMMMYYA